jgi:hypothetical protein
VLHVVDQFADAHPTTEALLIKAAKGILFVVAKTAVAGRGNPKCLHGERPPTSGIFHGGNAMNSIIQHPEPARPILSLPLAERERRVEQQISVLEQQRQELTKALAGAEQSARLFPTGSLEHQKAKARVTRLHDGLRLLKAKRDVAQKYQNLGDFLIQIFKEKSSQAEWQQIVAEARRRHDSQQGLADVDEVLMSSNPLASVN